MMQESGVCWLCLMLLIVQGNTGLGVKKPPLSCELLG